MSTIISCAVNVNGLIVSLPKPNRHCQIMHAFYYEIGKGLQKYEQGFLTSEGVFVNREEAYLIAEQNNQIIKIVTDKTDRRLFSENLW